MYICTIIFKFKFAFLFCSASVSLSVTQSNQLSAHIMMMKIRTLVKAKINTICQNSAVVFTYIAKILKLICEILK